MFDIFFLRRKYKKDLQILHARLHLINAAIVKINTNQQDLYIEFTNEKASVQRQIEKLQILL